MAKKHSHSWIFGLLAVLSCASGVSAQEAALDTATHPHAAPALSSQPVPVGPALGNEHQSNLRHWNQFSHSSSKPFFKKVPAGTRHFDAKSHYVKPQCIEAGKVPPGTPQQAQNGAVKRYLAYNVPAGAFVKKQPLTAPVQPKGAVAPRKTAAPKKTTIKSDPALVEVLSYGHKGEVKTHYVPRRLHHRTAVSSYSFYY